MQSGYCLVQCEEQKLERERERGGRGGCCEVKQLLYTWGVPTDKLLACHLISSL